ncbi:hypothetical protein K2Y00_03750 [Patescibacteria group bacterium]|nr:hypothetical protein [Patescibacteria group bacterium]
MTITNRVLSVLLVPVFVVTAFAFATPVLADDGYSAPGQAWAGSPTTSSKPRTSSVPTYYGGSSSGKKPTSSYCYTCGGGGYSNYGSLSSTRSLYLSLDFSRNDIDQSVDNSITNNVNVNGNNNNVGINNSQETNQNAGITTSRGYYEHSDRSSYYDYFRRFNSSSSYNSNSSGDAGQTNNTHQSNIFNSNKNNDDDDDDDNDNDDLWCEIDASDTSVDEGDRITLEWDTRGAEDARINQGIGSVDEDGGTERVEIDRTTTFRLTVEDEDGDEEDCSVTVRVNDENEFSNIVIDEEPTYVPPQYYSGVYLSDIPYTGLDMGPYAWAYWAALAALGAAGTYVFFFMGLPFVLRRAGALSEEVEAELSEENASPVQQSTMTMPVAATSTGTAVIASQSDITKFVAALLSADNDTASDILEDATKDGASASVFLNRASAMLRSEVAAPTIAAGIDTSVLEALVDSLEAAAKARA